VVRWLQNSSIAQYFEDHPPCYTNLSNKAPTPLTFQHDTQQSELINDRDADSSEDSIGSTQFCVSNNRGIGTYVSIGTYTFIGTYTLKGAFTLKGTYETKGTFLTHAKTPVAETGYPPQRVT
jgi:hypothetical protein